MTVASVLTVDDEGFLEGRTSRESSSSAAKVVTEGTGGMAGTGGGGWRSILVLALDEAKVVDRLSVGRGSYSHVGLTDLARLARVLDYT